MDKPQNKGLIKEEEDRKLFREKMDKASKIAADAGRKAHANYMIVSPQVAAMIDSFNEQDDL